GHRVPRKAGLGVDRARTLRRDAVELLHVGRRDRRGGREPFRTQSVRVRGGADGGDRRLRSLLVFRAHLEDLTLRADRDIAEAAVPALRDVVTLGERPDLPQSGHTRAGRLQDAVVVPREPDGSGARHDRRLIDGRALPARLSLLLAAARLL